MIPVALTREHGRQHFPLAEAAGYFRCGRCIEAEEMCRKRRTIINSRAETERFLAKIAQARTAPLTALRVEFAVSLAASLAASAALQATG